MISVLPYDLGLQLGLDWNQVPYAISLSGAMGGTAKAVVLSTAVGTFPPVNVVFAWSSNPNVRLILGQQNFFKEFDVSFFGSRG